MDTKIVRVNGVHFRIPADELTDPHGSDAPGGCFAVEPDNPELTGGAVCTLAPHDERVMHIAHDGDWNVIAMWGTPAVRTEEDEEE